MNRMNQLLGITAGFLLAMSSNSHGSNRIFDSLDAAAEQTFLSVPVANALAITIDGNANTATSLPEAVAELSQDLLDQATVSRDLGARLRGANYTLVETPNIAAVLDKVSEDLGSDPIGVIRGFGMKIHGVNYTSADSMPGGSTIFAEAPHIDGGLQTLSGDLDHIKNQILATGTKIQGSPFADTNIMAAITSLSTRLNKVVQSSMPADKTLTTALTALSGAPTTPLTNIQSGVDKIHYLAGPFSPSTNALKELLDLGLIIKGSPYMGHDRFSTLIAQIKSDLQGLISPVGTATNNTLTGVLTNLSGAPTTSPGNLQGGINAIQTAVGDFTTANPPHALGAFQDLGIAIGGNKYIETSLKDVSDTLSGDLSASTGAMTIALNTLGNNTAKTYGPPIGATGEFMTYTNYLGSFVGPVGFAGSGEGPNYVAGAAKQHGGILGYLNNQDSAGTLLTGNGVTYTP